MIRVAIRLVCAYCKTGVQEQHAAIGPRCQETAILGWRREGRVILLQGNVDVLERRGRGGRRADGEAETMRLVQVVIGVLADDDGFDGVEGCMA